jgi:hypothetical protein
VSEHGAAVMTREELTVVAARPIPMKARRTAIAAALIGLVVFVVTAFVDPDRAWRAFHFNWLFLTILSCAGITFVAVTRITTARWSRAVIRLLEGYVAFLPIGWIGLVLIFTFGRTHIFPWATMTPPGPEKRIYLDPAFLIPRDLIALGILTVLGLWFVYLSVRLDVGVIPEAGAAWARGIRERMRAGFGDERRELHSTHSLQGKLAVVMTLGYAFFWELLAFDMSMTLDMHFQGTLFGWWEFMTGWVSALMLWSLITVWARRNLHAESLIETRHFHDLGKLGFAFTVFWAYLTFAQYLIGWYGNMGVETHWPRLRFIPPWQPYTSVVVLLMFFVPFFGLLSRAAKEYLPTLVLFSACSVIGAWLQRFIEVYPSLYGLPAHAPFGVPEIGVALLFLGVWAWAYFSFLDAFPKFRIVLATSPYRDEIQVPVDPRTMEPLPAHE